MLGEILSNQTIGIFIEAAFPGGIGMSKKETHLEGLGDRLMVSEFLPLSDVKVCSGRARGFNKAITTVATESALLRTTLAKRVKRDLRSVKETRAC